MSDKPEAKTEQTPLPPDLILNPDGTAVFTLQDEGEVLGTYKGTFTFRCFLDPLATLSAGRVYRDLLGPNPQDASETERFLAFSLSQLQKRIIKAPPFWNTDSMLAGNIPDVNIISTVLARAIDAEVAYKERLKDKKKEALEKSNEVINQIKQKVTEGE